VSSATTFGLRCAAIAAFTALAACSNVEDLFVAPGKFAIYSCAELETQGRATVTRERELKILMGKASQGAGGELVNTLAYRGEYLATQGQLKQLEQAAIERKCDMTWRTVSDRSMW
jgi:hypothetical protein